MNTAPFRKLTTTACFSLVVTIFLSTPVEALEIVVKKNPVQSGRGSNLTARFAKVATLDGRHIDLLAEIVSQSQRRVTHKFYRSGDDFGILLNSAGSQEKRVATVRYSFLDSKTSAPVTLPDFALTITDLDGTKLHTDSVATSDSYGYTLNDPTNVAVTPSGTEVSFRGTKKQKEKSPQPEAAVQLRFANRSSYSVTYTSKNQAPHPADFTHDGNGEFVFSKPAYTSSPKRLYYTFTYKNQEAGPVWMNFYDQLPEGLSWDPDYVPETVGDLGEVVVRYSHNHRDASIGSHLMPPGFSSFKLRTQPTQMTGQIDNSATLRFAQHSNRAFNPGQSNSAAATDAQPDETLITEKTVSSTVMINDDAPRSSRRSSPWLSPRKSP